MKETLKNIIRIGKRESSVDLTDFLPNHPQLRGSEDIFSITWANASNLINKEIKYLIIGLHQIELEYRSKTNNDFGFGSPSPTFKLIKSLVEKDEILARELYSWIEENGGNYYIPKTRLKTRATEIKEKKEFEDEVTRLRTTKKAKIQEEHKQVLENQLMNKSIRAQLLNISIEELIETIKEDSVKPIHYYEEAILNLLNGKLGKEHLSILDETIKNKYNLKNCKMTKKIIERIESSR